MYINVELALDTVLRELHQHILPELKSRQGQLSGQVVTMILSFIATCDANDRSAKSAAHRADLIRLLEDGVQTLTEAGIAPASIDEILGALASSESSVDSGRRLDLPRLLESIQDAMAPLAANGDQAAHRWLARLIDAEIGRLRDSTSAQNQRVNGSHPNFEVNEQRLVTDAEFCAYLRRRFPAHPQIGGCVIQEVAGGFSKRTYLIDIENAPPQLSRVVLRQDSPGGPTGTCVLDEPPILVRVHAAGLSVPKVLWAEPDVSAFDVPFIVMERMEGVCAISEWQRRSKSGRMPIEDLARQLAALHQLPVDGLSDQNRFSDPRDYLLNYIEQFETRWIRDRIVYEPTLKFAFDWLKRHVPQNIERLSIVHGDLSERNILLQDGDITGILDWELWHIGDPNEEIAYAQPFIEQVIPMEQFLTLYYAHGGPIYRPENARFWRPWYMIRAGAQIASAMSTFVGGHNRTSKLCAAILNYYQQMICETNSIMKDAWGS
jgi:aminoglycoside phosphotransferase (APT) family kinase protein